MFARPIHSCVRACVRPSVRSSVHPSVRPSVHPSTCQIHQSWLNRGTFKQSACADTNQAKKFKTTTFEYICVKVYSKGSSQMLAVIYRPGSVQSSSAFFDDFTESVVVLPTSGHNNRRHQRSLQEIVYMATASGASYKDISDEGGHF